MAGMRGLFDLESYEGRTTPGWAWGAVAVEFLLPLNQLQLAYAAFNACTLTRRDSSGAGQRYAPARDQVPVPVHSSWGA